MFKVLNLVGLKIFNLHTRWLEALGQSKSLNFNHLQVLCGLLVTLQLIIDVILV